MTGARIALCSGIVLLQMAWRLATPPFAGPDEWAHEVRAAAVGLGLTEHRVTTYGPADGFSPPQLRYLLQTTRAFDLPWYLAPSNTCFAFQPRLSGACLEQHTSPTPTATGTVRAATVVGAYPPAGYLVPGLAIRLAADPQMALLLARVAHAASCATLLCLAAVLALGASTRQAAGVAMALTPMVAFVASVLAPSGLEIAAAVAVSVALMRLATDERPNRLAWWVAGIAGILLAIVRPLGPLFLAADCCVTATVAGATRLRAISKQGTALLAVFATAVALNLGWRWSHPIEVAIGAFSWEGLGTAFAQLRGLLREEFGVFQYLDTPMQPIAYWVLAIAHLAWLTLAVVRASARGTIVLVGAVLAVVSITVLLDVVLVQPTDFPMQGRYLLPLWVMLPILAAATPVRHASLQTNPIWVACSLCASSAHLLGWYANARRSAVGTSGPWHFIPVAQWAPMTGWWPLLMCIVVGAALVPIGLWLRPSED